MVRFVDFRNMSYIDTVDINRVRHVFNTLSNPYLFRIYKNNLVTSGFGKMVSESLKGFKPDLSCSTLNPEFIARNYYNFPVTKKGIATHTYDARTIATWCEETGSTEYEGIPYYAWVLVAFEEDRMRGIPGPSIDIRMLFDQEVFRAARHSHSGMRLFVYSVYLCSGYHETDRLFIGTLLEEHEIFSCPYFHHLKTANIFVSGCMHMKQYCGKRCEDGCAKCVDRALRNRDIDYMCEEFSRIYKGYEWMYIGEKGREALSLFREILLYYRNMNAREIMDLRLRFFRNKEPKYPLFSYYVFNYDEYIEGANLVPWFYVEKSDEQFVFEVVDSLSDFYVYLTEYTRDYNPYRDMKRFKQVMKRIKGLRLTRGFNLLLDIERHARIYPLTSQVRKKVRNYIVPNEMVKNVYITGLGAFYDGVCDLRDEKEIVFTKRYSKELDISMLASIGEAIDVKSLTSSVDVNFSEAVISDDDPEYIEALLSPVVPIVQTAVTTVLGGFSFCGHTNFCCCIPSPYFTGSSLKVIKNVRTSKTMSIPSDYGPVTTLVPPRQCNVVRSMVRICDMDDNQLGHGVFWGPYIIYPAHLFAMRESDVFKAISYRSRNVHEVYYIKQKFSYAPYDIALASVVKGDALDVFGDASTSVGFSSVGVNRELTNLRLFGSLNEQDRNPVNCYKNDFINGYVVDNVSILINRQMFKGCSGAPLVNVKGKVIGMYLGVVRDVPKNMDVNEYVYRNNIVDMGVCIAFNARVRNILLNSLINDNSAANVLATMSKYGEI